MTRPSPIPTMAPVAAETSAYNHPSVAKPATSGPRRIPIARSMPSCDRRSSASMTKMLISSNTPAATANMPIVKYSWES
jgi:hypothetical protein